MLKRIGRFIRGIFRRPRFVPGAVQDGLEMEQEKERRRGVRGD
jgi:hypothetical protein